MADYSIALGVQPPQIDVTNALSMAAQMQRNKLAEQQALHGMRNDADRLALAREQASHGMRNDDARLALAQGQASTERQLAAERLAAAQGQRNALSEYSSAMGAGDENALAKLSAYPEIQSQVLQARNQMAEGDRQAFDQKLLRNARRAQYVSGLQGNEKIQAWQQSLGEALQSGDISQEMHDQYVATPPNDLLLHNVISQAAPIQQIYAGQEPTADMRNLEAAGIERGTQEYKAAATKGMFLPQFQKVGDRLLKIDPMGGDPVDITPGGRPPVGTGELSTGERWRMKGGQLDLDSSGRPIAEPIPGSSREAVSAETAARIGLADKFLNEYEDLRQNIAGGKMGTSLGYETDMGVNLDYHLGRGEAGELYRKIEDGSEALVRNLTGAGMNEAEAEAYAKRYLPKATDGRETVLRKLDNLAENLNAVLNRVQTGRGRAGIDAPAELAPGGGAANQTTPDQSPPVQVGSPQEAMQLAPGTRFVTPDGRVKVRP